MVEIKFVLKCLAITAVLLAALQFKVQGVPAENFVSNYLRSGKVVVWVRESIRGGHHFIMREGREFAPKVMSASWIPSWSTNTSENKNTGLQSRDTQNSESEKNTSTDIPETEFPDGEINEESDEQAGAF